MAKKLEKPEACSHEACNCACSCGGGKLLLLCLAALGAIFSIITCLIACGVLKLTQKLYDFNVVSAGGQENFERMVRVYQSQGYIDYMSQYAQQGEEQFGLLEDTTEEDNTIVANGSDDIKAIVEDMLASTPIRGDANARFTIIEYTELLCPYCQRHSQEGTINAVMEQFPGEVNSISKHFIIHGDTALQLAAAMECVAELKPEVYNETFEKGFEAYPVDLATLTDIATGLGVDATALQSCIDEGRYTQAVNDMMSQGNKLFGVNGTPGNVIVDRETGNYQLVSGAYPVDTFVETINAMKNA